MNNEFNSLRKFGKCRLDVEKKFLWCGDQPVQLPLKAIELLCVLVESGGTVVTKDEIWQSVWQNAFVEETNLTHNIYLLRKTFKDLGEPDLIKTVPRRGYRFAGEVSEAKNGSSDIIIERHALTRTLIEEVSEPFSVAGGLSWQKLNSNADESIAKVQLPTAIGGSVPSRRRVAGSLIVASILAIVFLIGVTAFLNYQNSPVKTSLTEIKSIAVLPLKSFASKNEDEELRLQITDALITKLGSLNEISVRPTNSVLRFAGEGQDTIEVGEKLSVDAILDGRVQRENDRLRVTLQLVSVKTGEQVWSEQFDGKTGEILALQDVIASHLVRKFAFVETEKFNRRPTESNKAYEAYLKGRYFWNQRTSDSYFKAIRYFEEAIGLDPNFALGYSGIADCYALLEQRGGLPPEEAFPKAEEAARKALELDETLAEAHASMGLIKSLYRWDWNESEKHYKRAIELNPNYATGYGGYGMLLIVEKRFDEAEAQLKKAESLDPTSRSIAIYLAWTFYFGRQFDQAIEQSRKILELDNSLATPYMIQSAAFEQKGMFDEAVEAELKKLKGRDLPTIESLKDAYRKFGIKGFRQKQIEIFQEKTNSVSEVGNYHIAARYALLNRSAEALQQIEKGFINRGSMWHMVNVDPAFDSLRSEPRFQEVLRKMNLQ